MLKKTNILIFLLALILIITSCGAYYFYSRAHKAEQDPSILAQQEVASVVAIVGQLMVLPPDETPFLATVMNKENLQDQPFFADAEDGDKLLIYAQEMKAILYRPSTNKVINVEPIVLNAPQKALKIAYYNGTETAWITDSVEEKIQTTFGALTQTASKGEAIKKDYQDTIVVDLTGKNSTSTQVIAAFMGGKMGSLPEGEVAPTGADALIILGKNIIAQVSEKQLLKVAYYNGSETVGITAGMEEKIQATFGALTQTASKDNAIKKDYQGILVVDLTGRNATSTQVIASFIDGKVGSLPAEETKPEADILILLGN
ncbi:MAG: hypothetical protein WC415_01935 [Patescibacteria group bacterium]|jgi:hypothetical protein